MNEAVVKWFALGTIATVVMGALWLAASVQAVRGEAHQRGMGRAALGPVSHASIIPNLSMAALPPQQAASGVVSTRTQASVR